MARRRFYLAPAQFAASDKSVELSLEESRHLRDVLRLRAGDEAYVFDGEGHEYLCAVLDPGSGRESAKLSLDRSVAPARPESTFHLTIAIALLKGEKFDMVVQKLTEVGVVGIIPVITSRADVRLRDASDTAKRIARWERLAIEACKQSGRAARPHVEAPISFQNLIERGTSPGNKLRLMFAERGGVELSLHLNRAGARTTSAVALIGPEGGWEDDEISQANEAGWKIVTLGGRIMRSETAAIVIAGLLQNQLGDLR